MTCSYHPCSAWIQMLLLVFQSETLKTDQEKSLVSDVTDRYICNLYQLLKLEHTHLTLMNPYLRSVTVRTKLSVFLNLLHWTTFWLIIQSWSASELKIFLSQLLLIQYRVGRWKSCSSHCRCRNQWLLLISPFLVMINYSVII